jgi:NADH-quinone oxidoreductase subunit N
LTINQTMAFLPEIVLLTGALVLFCICLGDARQRLARTATLVIAVATIGACVLSFGRDALLFYGAYRVDTFSQVLKLVLATGLLLITLVGGTLPDIREELKAEYHMFVAISVAGLVMLVSAVDIITLVVALEVSSFPLYLLVPMRREGQGHRTQMESAMKYMMFGVAANGIMLFGLSFLFGLTGTTSLPVMLDRLQPQLASPIALLGLAMTLAGLYYKLAVFPFHFWTPDVYQGASNETASLIASLPKVGAVAILVRFVSLATPDTALLAMLLGVLACFSMFYGNLIALLQSDFKRLLGFSGIAHAGYALVGFVALSQNGYSAALYYIVGYVFMVLACFVVICHVSTDGTNIRIEELAGLHRRSPLLAVTLAAGVFGLAGIPPFVGFMGKLTLFSAALAKGYLALVILAVINTAIAAYYYLSVIREAWFRDASSSAPIALRPAARILCVGLIVGIVGLGVLPGRFLTTISSSIAQTTTQRSPSQPVMAGPRSPEAVARAVGFSHSSVLSKTSAAPQQ